MVWMKQDDNLLISGEDVWIPKKEYAEMKRQIKHWKKCAESEQNIARKLQKKVERCEKEIERLKEFEKACEGLKKSF